MKCPFELKWSLVNHKKPYRHDIFYKVKITSLPSIQHTCMMSHIGYILALRSRSGHNKIDLNSMNTAVSVLKTNPSMPAQMLRPLLKNCLPCNTNLDGKFLDNFRRRVALHHAKNPNQTILSMEECEALNSRQDLSQSDFIGMNNPLVKANLNDIYAKIMENDSNVWLVLQFF